MKGKRKLIIMSVLMIVILQIAITTNVSANKILNDKSKNNIIIVDINGNGDFKKINDAINSAETDSIIYIKKGEYNEIVDIKNKIYLIGEDMSKTIINPISEKNKYAIRLGAQGIKIVGLSIKNKAPGLYTTGIKIVSQNTIVSDCNIYDTPIGIAIWTSNNIIKNCNFWGCEDEAIALLGTPYSECNKNNILNCKFYNNCDGIELQYSSYNTIKNCEFYDNTHTGIDAISNSNNNNVISNCNIYKNKVNGIYISSSSENKIIDSSIFNNGDDDIVFFGKSENNKVLNTLNYDLIKNKFSDLSDFNNIVNKISNNIKQKLFFIYKSLSYFKEKYKF